VIIVLAVLKIAIAHSCLSPGNNEQGSDTSTDLPIATFYVSYGVLNHVDSKNISFLDDLNSLSRQVIMNVSVK
jgi:hypothetical protein